MDALCSKLQKLARTHGLEMEYEPPGFWVSIPEWIASTFELLLREKLQREGGKGEALQVYVDSEQKVRVLRDLLHRSEQQVH